MSQLKNLYDGLEKFLTIYMKQIIMVRKKTQIQLIFLY